MTHSPTERHPTSPPRSRWLRPAGGLLLTLLASLPLVGHTEIYKCRLPGGKTEISNTPCATPASTLSVRPEEPVADANREQVERDVARMRDFVDKRAAAKRAEDEAEQRRLADVREAYARQRVYQSANLADCLAELDQQIIDSRRRGELEAVCWAKPRVETPPPAPTPVIVVPAYGLPSPGNAVALCIQNVMRLRLAPAEQNRRIDLCQGLLSPVPPPLLQPPVTLPSQPTSPPQRPCPPGDKYCVR